MGENYLYKLPIKAYSAGRSRWSSRIETSFPVVALRVVSWNVDFMAPDSAGRVACVLDYLRRKVLTGESPQPSCILLQELDSSSFSAVLENEWVRKHYAVTPPDMSRWGGSYGVATLVSRFVRIRAAYMLQFTRSQMGRTALFVDVEMWHEGGEGPDDIHVVRIANTHLESLPVGQRQRPLQLCAISDLLRAPGVDAGLVAGDMNIIAPPDERIHVVAALEDVCPDTSSESFTWGYQPRTRFPPGRLDRVFCVPGTLKTRKFEVIGRGLKTNSGLWASDHYGMKVHVQLPDMSHEEESRRRGMPRRRM